MVNARLCFFLICLLVLLQSESTACVKLTLVKDAVAKGAVCLDGSPPAYQLDRGVGEGANKWLVHLEGGAWCESVDACRKRKQYGLGSSHLMKEMRFGGILSNSQSVNPNFYYWNRVFVRYCDGSSFTGDVEQVNVTDPLYYRGEKVFDAIVEDILEKGMYNASNALLSGCSAGGLAAILHCDKFRGLLPPSTKVKCFSDGGYFVHAKDISGGYHYEQVMFDRVVALLGSEKNLPRSCTSVTKPGALCFYPQYVAPHIKTPLFILNSLYDTWQVSFIFSLANIPAGRSWVDCQFEVSNCSECQKQTLQGFRVQVLGAVLNGLTNRSSRGFFLNTCHTHCQSLHSYKWMGKHGSMLHNKSISEALGEWYYDQRPVQLIETRDLLPHWCVLDKSEPNPTNNYTWNGSIVHRLASWSFV